MLDDFADEREAVGVNSRGRDTNEDIALLDVWTRQERLTLDRADCETSSVVFIWRYRLGEREACVSSRPGVHRLLVTDPQSST